MIDYSEITLDDVSVFDRMLEWIKSSDILATRLKGEPIYEDYMTKDNFDIVSKDNKLCLFHNARFDSHEGYDFSEVSRLSEEVFVRKTGITNFEKKRVAKTWYPAGGHLGWHKDGAGGRFYSTYAEGKSFFRFIHPQTGEIITSWDKPGWTFRIFYTDDKSPLWHCVGAEDTRISIGYRFVLS